ncbi:Monoglyceride lipase, partial [Globisporangium splendens]
MVAVLEVTGAVAIGYVLWKALAGICGWTHSHHALPHASHTLKRSTSAEKAHAIDVLRPFFTTKHGFALFVRKWLPRHDTKPRGVVFLVHGIGEHGGRYDHVARLLARAGFAVFSVDHQGHGLSDGERMFAQKFVHLAEDYLEFVNHVLHGPQDEFANANVLDPSLDAHADVDFSKLPRFVFGHSMGGVVTLQIAELSYARNLKWDGVVLSAPAIYCAPLGKHPWFLSLIAKLSTWMPKNTLAPLGFDVLGNDPDVATRWLRDPLRPAHGATIRLAAELIKTGRQYAQEECKFTTEQFDSPLYVLHGEHDQVCFAKGSVRFYTKCATKDKTLNVVPTELHEVLNLDGYDQVIQEIIEWMGKRLDN